MPPGFPIVPRMKNPNRVARGLSRTRTEPYVRLPWTPEEDQSLGKAADGVIAALLCRSVGSVGARRHYLGIPAAVGRGRPVGWRKTLGMTVPPALAMTRE